MSLYSSDTSNLTVVILAAGQGKRMKSRLPKVLHPLGGQPLLGHVLDRARELLPQKIIVVGGVGFDQVQNYVTRYQKNHSDCRIALVLQAEQKGTGHAVQMALPHLTEKAGDILVLFGDTPLLQNKTLEALLTVQRADEKTAVSILGMRLQNPGAYGRILTQEKGAVEAIIEARDATPDQLKINLCNSGVMAFKGACLPAILDQLSPQNAQGEYYLTDAVQIARSPDFAEKMGRETIFNAAVCEAEPWELQGVNNRQDLAAVEAAFQEKRRVEAMEAGVTLVDPSSVFFSYDTKMAPDVYIEPHVFFGPGVSIERDVSIKSYSHLEGAVVRSGATVGPFARLRPGADIGEGAKVGNFVEIKKAILGEGAKVSHLSYIGDADVHAQVNIGAGTITCNYDGVNKHKTTIEKGAFVGTNTALVAPVTVGEGAFIAAGSTITKNVPADSLGLSRAPQKNLEGAAARLRIKNQLLKKTS